MRLSIHEWCALPIALGSAIGVVIYGTFVTIPGPFRVSPTSVGFWLSALVLYFSLLLIFHARYKHNRTKLSIFYHFLATAFFLIVGICYTFGQTADAAAWTAVGLLVNLLTMHFLLKPHVKEDSETVIGLVNENSISDERSNTKSCLLYANSIIAGFALVFLGMLIGGAAIQARSYNFVIKGQYATVHVNDTSNHTLRIRYLCKGPNDTGKATFIIDADGAHAAADFYGIQDILAQKGRRSCIFDKPGLGWSDNYYASQRMDPLTWYHSLMNSMGEKPPFIFAAWGGAGPVIWQYANEHPDMVSGIAYLDSYGDGIEWRVVQYMQNLTQQELLDLRIQDIAGRNRIFALIRAVGVPWGIIELLLPTDPDKFDEYHWYYVTAKTWATQYFALQIMATDRLEKGWLGTFNYTNPQLHGLPVVMIMSDLNNTDVCKKANLEWGTKGCNDAIETNAFMKREQVFISGLTGNGTLYKCTDITCDLSFPVSKANWTAIALANSFPY